MMSNFKTRQYKNCGILKTNYLFVKTYECAIISQFGKIQVAMWLEDQSQVSIVWTPTLLWILVSKQQTTHQMHTLAGFETGLGKWLSVTTGDNIVLSHSTIGSFQFNINLATYILYIELSIVVWKIHSILQTYSMQHDHLLTWNQLFQDSLSCTIAWNYFLHTRSFIFYQSQQDQHIPYIYYMLEVPWDKLKRYSCFYTVV